MKILKYELNWPIASPLLEFQHYVTFRRRGLMSVSRNTTPYSVEDYFANVQRNLGAMNSTVSTAEFMKLRILYQFTVS